MEQLQHRVSTPTLWEYSHIVELFLHGESTPTWWEYSHIVEVIVVDVVVVTTTTTTTIAVRAQNMYSHDCGNRCVAHSIACAALGLLEYFRNHCQRALGIGLVVVNGLWAIGHGLLDEVFSL